MKQADISGCKNWLQKYFNQNKGGEKGISLVSTYSSWTLRPTSESSGDLTSSSVLQHSILSYF